MLKHDLTRSSRFQCDDCPSSFRYPKDLRRHRDARHSEVGFHACKECGKVYKRKDHLYRHTKQTGHVAASASTFISTSSDHTGLPASPTMCSAFAASVSSGSTTFSARSYESVSSAPSVITDFSNYYSEDLDADHMGTPHEDMCFDYRTYDETMGPRPDGYTNRPLPQTTSSLRNEMFITSDQSKSHESYEATNPSEPKSWEPSRADFINKSLEESESTAARSDAKPLETDRYWWRRSSICSADQKLDPTTDGSSKNVPCRLEFIAEYRRATSSSDHEVNFKSPSGAAMDSFSDIIAPKTPLEVEALRGLDVDGDRGDADLDHKSQDISRVSPKASDSAGRIEPDAVVVPSATHLATSVFAEAREDLKYLKGDIEELDDSEEISEDDAETSSPTLHIPHQDGGGLISDNAANTCCGEPTEHCGGQQDFCTETSSSQGSQPSPFQSQANKRLQLDDAGEDNVRTAVGLSNKKAKTSCERFICCFQNGPGRACPGTDARISDVVKNLADKHKIHICDICWVLKVKDEPLGSFVHPGGDQSCQDHCLSPRCGNTGGLTIGHRHLFNPQTCGNGKLKTSRVSPIDREAAYRFIFLLVHPTREPTETVLTADNSHHFDTVPRQGNRKPTREELQMRANDLERKIEAGDKHNVANAARIEQLERDDIAKAARIEHLELELAAEKNKVSKLQKRQRRIVLVLGEALQAGTFPTDSAAYRNLRERVNDYAPDALSFESQLLLTPPTSNDSQRSSTTPTQDDANISSAGQGTQDTERQADFQNVSPQSSFDRSFDHDTAQRLAAGGCGPQGGHKLTHNGLEASDFSPAPMAQPTLTGSERSKSKHNESFSADAAALEGSTPAGAEHRTMTVGTGTDQIGSDASNTDLQYDETMIFDADNFNFEEYIQYHGDSIQDDFTFGAAHLQVGGQMQES
jgi:hypothetical protein